jgi:hypothetical protein
MQQFYTAHLATNYHSEEILRRLKKFLSQSLFNPRIKDQEIEDLLILLTERIAGSKLLFERVLKYCFRRRLDPAGADKRGEEHHRIAETLWKIPPGMCILRLGRKMLGTCRRRRGDNAERSAVSP